MSVRNQGRHVISCKEDDFVVLLLLVFQLKSAFEISYLAHDRLGP